MTTSTTRPAELNSGVWTSWIPLTTAWPSQAACSSLAWARVGLQPESQFWPYIYDPDYGKSVENSPTCLPPQVTKWADADGGNTISKPFTSWSISPIVCPEAFTTISTSIVSGSSTLSYAVQRSYTHSCKTIKHT
jgi:hypothetical protein